MNRRIAFAALLTAVCAAGVTGQQADPATHVYEAFYKMSYADLQDWVSVYAEHVVPVLTTMRDEGMIEGWGHWLHQTGGDHNVRLAIRTRDWASLGDFWAEYPSRLMASMPEGGFEKVSRMVQSHDDEVWNILAVNVPEGLETTHFYTSTFQHNFADAEEWNGIWENVTAPIVAEAMEAGLIGGWVRLTHNTGGDRSFKVLYMFEDWDDIDDFFGMVQGRLATEHPAAMQRISEMMTGHDDEIWVPGTQTGG